MHGVTKLITVLLLGLIVLMTGSSQYARAQQSAGNESVYAFLLLPPSARTAALGGNHVSLHQPDVSLFTLNPAYIHEHTHRQISVSYLHHLADVYYGQSAFSYAIDRVGTLAAGVRFVNYGSFTRTDAEGNVSGTFHAYDMAWSLALSRELADGLHAGAGLHVIHSRYDAYASSAVALFGGLYYRLPNELTRLGITVHNLGRQISAFDQTHEPLPFTITAGVSHKLQHLPLRFNLAVHSLEQWKMPVFDDAEDPGFTAHLMRHMRPGLEILFTDQFHLRLGYDHLRNRELASERRIDFSGTGLGLGIVVRDLYLDISRTSLSESGALMQLTLGMNL